MVDSADPGFYGAAWRFTDFCQQFSAGSVYLQFVLKSRPEVESDLRGALARDAAPPPDFCSSAIVKSSPSERPIPPLRLKMERDRSLLDPATARWKRDAAS